MCFRRGGWGCRTKNGKDASAFSGAERDISLYRRSDDFDPFIETLFIHQGKPVLKRGAPVYKRCLERAVCNA